MKALLTIIIFILPLQLFCDENSPTSLAGKIDLFVSNHDSTMFLTHYINENSFYERSTWSGGLEQEEFDDSNLDGTWTPAEVFADANLNGQWDDGELFNDANLNGVYDAAESFNDSNNNGVWDDYIQLEELSTNSYTWDSENSAVQTAYEHDEYTSELRFFNKINDSIYTYVLNGGYGIIYDENLDLDKNGVADKEQLLSMQDVGFFFGSNNHGNQTIWQSSLKDIL